MGPWETQGSPAADARREDSVSEDNLRRACLRSEPRWYCATLPAPDQGGWHRGIAKAQRSLKKPRFRRPRFGAELLVHGPPRDCNRDRRAVQMEVRARWVVTRRRRGPAGNQADTPKVITRDPRSLENPGRPSTLPPLRAAGFDERHCWACTSRRGGRRPSRGRSAL